MQLVPTGVHAATGHTGGAALVKGAGGVAGVAAVGSAEAAQQGIFGTGVTWPDVGNFVVDFLVPGGVGGVGEGSDISRTIPLALTDRSSLNSGWASGMGGQGLADFTTGSPSSPYSGMNWWDPVPSRGK